MQYVSIGFLRQAFIASARKKNGPPQYYPAAQQVMATMAAQT